SRQRAPGPVPQPNPSRATSRRTPASGASTMCRVGSSTTRPSLSGATPPRTRRDRMGVGGRSARQDAERTQPRQRSGELQSTWSATNHMRIISGGRRIRRVTTLKISPFMFGFCLVLGTACSAYTMRESFPPGHEGSSSRLVAYAYFTTRVDRPLGYYLPVGYKEFNVETDENVIFVGAINYPGRAYLLRGILHRPDGTPYAEFTRSVPTSSLGGQ